MFKSEKKEALGPVSANQIFAGTTIKGDIQSTNDIRIDGIIIGTINCQGKVVLGKSGRIEGVVTCQTADISGEVKGNINVADLLALKATANLEGDIITGKLAIEPGANFTGTCSMGAVVKDLKGEQSDRKLKEKTA